MPGPVALVGAGEFLPAMLDFDLELLAATGRPRPRVAILPTASYPDGEAVFDRWAAMGVAHFGGLGAEVEPVLVRDRASADDTGFAQAVGEADLIYLSGGKPGYLLGALEGSAVGPGDRRRARAGGGARRVLGGRDGPRRPHVRLPGARSSRGRSSGGQGWRSPRACRSLPHYDAWPEPMSALVALQAPRGSVVLGIDEDTAVIGRDGAWQVHGAARVTVWRGRRRERHRAGEVFTV